MNSENIVFDMHKGYLWVSNMSIPLGRSIHKKKSPYFCDMDKFELLERRRIRLIGLRESFCGGVNAVLAGRIKKDSTYVDRLFYPQGKKGKKNIGDEIILACTNEFELPGGWFDADPNTVNLNIEDRELLELVRTLVKLPENSRKSIKTIYDEAIKLSTGKDIANERGNDEAEHK